MKNFSSLSSFLSPSRLDPEGQSPLKHNTNSNSVYSEPFNKDYLSGQDFYQDKAITHANKMYYSQDLNYDKIRRALTNQLESLKEQIRLNGEIQKKELERLCEDYEIRLASIRREKDKTVSELCLEIQETEETIHNSRNKIEQEKFDLEDLQNSHNSTVYNLTNEIRELEEKIRLSKDFLENKASKEVKHLENLINSQIEDHKKALETISIRHEDETKKIKTEIEFFDQKIEECEVDILKYREKILEQKETVKEDIFNMKNTLKVSSLSLKSQKNELKKMIQSENEAKSQESLLKKELNLLDREIKRVHNDNKRLRDEIKKLDQLVYGKNVINHKI